MNFINNEGIAGLLEDVRKLSRRLLHVIKKVDGALLQMKANQEEIDKGKAEIARLKKPMP